MEDRKKAGQLRRDVLDMLYGCQSGHPGGSLSCVEILMMLFYKTMKGRSPQQPDNPHRDRFVLSKGHACPVLYAVLADQGYFPKEDLKSLRQIGSHLQGHPDFTKTPGVDMNTGSLGQGASLAMGLALAARHGGKDLKVYALLGDGECQEGLVWESAMSAAHYGLDNLTFLLDNNGLQLDGPTGRIMGLGDICGKFAAFGFDCFRVDGHDTEALVQALAEPSGGKPKFICCDTVKGKGVSFMEHDAGWHGKPMTEEQYIQAVKEVEAAYE